jgi:hypothetical protein
MPAEMNVRYERNGAPAPRRRVVVDRAHRSLTGCHLSIGWNSDLRSNRPFTAVTGVRIPWGRQNFVRMAAFGQEQTFATAFYCRAPFR